MPASLSYSCRCSRCDPARFSRTWAAVAESGQIVHVCSACAGCGIVLDPPVGARLNADHRTRLAARRKVGNSGSWDELGLPSMRRLGVTVGALDLVGRVPKELRFFKYAWENLDDAGLFGNVRSRLGLSRTFWPRAIVSAAWDRPVILHHGIAEKVANKRDNSHLHLVSLTARTIANPAEAWIADYGASRNLHLFARYEIGSEIVAHMVCVDTATALCTTAYHHGAGREDSKRHGTFHYASWAAPACV